MSGKADKETFMKCIISQLKERNIKEHSFGEVIFHSNRLLESLDYLQKESISRKLASAKSEDNADTPLHSSPKPEEISQLVKCCNLQKELAELHKKISEYALQIIDFKNNMDEKDKIIASQTNELQLSQNSIVKLQDLCQSYCQQVEMLKTTLQNKVDECDTLNITYSSLENKKNNLEIENEILRNELKFYKSKEPASLSSENVAMVVSSDIKVDTKPKRSQLEQVKQVQAESAKTDKNRTQPSDVAIPKYEFIPKYKFIPKYEFIAHDSEVNCVSWVPSSPQLITAGADRKIKLWDMTDSAMNQKKVVRDCNSAIMSIDLDIEAGLLLCASCDFASRVWTVSDFTIRHTLTGHSGRVMSAKFLQTENQIISGSLDQTLKLWDLRKRACIQTCSTGSNVNDVISKSGHTVISGHVNGNINFWDMKSNSLVAHVSCSAGVTSLDISKNGVCLLASQLDNKLVVIDVRMYKEICSLFGSGFEIGYDYTRAKFSPDNQYCCCGSRNGDIFIWNIPSGKVTKELKAHTAPVIACSWTACSSYLATCDSKKKCIVWSSK